MAAASSISSVTSGTSWLTPVRITSHAPVRDSGSLGHRSAISWAKRILSGSTCSTASRIRRPSSTRSIAHQSAKWGTASWATLFRVAW